MHLCLSRLSPHQWDALRATVGDRTDHTKAFAADLVWTIHDKFGEAVRAQVAKFARNSVLESVRIQQQDFYGSKATMMGVSRIERSVPQMDYCTSSSVFRALTQRTEVAEGVRDPAFQQVPVQSQLLKSGDCAQRNRNLTSQEISIKTQIDWWIARKLHEGMSRQKTTLVGNDIGLPSDVPRFWRFPNSEGIGLLS
jgi:hypothetical protein